LKNLKKQELFNTNNTWQTRKKSGQKLAVLKTLKKLPKQWKWLLQAK
jgi:hypothetical protein